jgi:hypothetical protein
MAASHKLNRLGSYTSLVGSPPKQPRAQPRPAVFDAGKRGILDPLAAAARGGLARISSSPLMRGPGNRVAAPSPVPPLLEQISESEGESVPATPLRKGARPAPREPAPEQPELELQPELVLNLPNFRKPTLSLGISFDDDDDWAQVSDDENELSLLAPASSGSPRQEKPQLSVYAGASEESYRFTDSGSISVDGLRGKIGGGKEYRDRLVFLQRLGSGASGVVYLALDLASVSLVAVKIISIVDRGKRRQMVHELAALGGHGGGAAAQASHGNVVGFVDAFGNAEDGTVGLIVEYMDGGSLEDIVQSGGCDNEQVSRQPYPAALPGFRGCNRPGIRVSTRGSDPLPVALPPSNPPPFPRSSRPSPSRCSSACSSCTSSAGRCTATSSRPTCSSTATATSRSGTLASRATWTATWTRPARPTCRAARRDTRPRKRRGKG